MFRTTTIAWLIILANAFAAEPLPPGLLPGQRPMPYSFLVATGPQRGQPTCYVCDAADRPLTIVFARDTSVPLAKLAQKLDRVLTAGKPAGMRAWLTVTGKDDGLEDRVAAWGRSAGIKQLPLGVFEDADGPPAYKLNRAATVTVLLAENRKVTSSFAFRDGELTDATIDEMLAAVMKLGGK